MWSNVSCSNEDESPPSDDFVSRRQNELSMEEAFKEVSTEVLEAIQSLYRENPRPGDRRYYDIVQRELERRR